MVRQWLGRLVRLVLAVSVLSGVASGQSRTQLAEIDKFVSEYRRLYQQGRYADAAAPAERLVVLAEQLHGRDHPQVGNALGLLADVYQQLGLFSKAEPLLKRDLVINEKSYGPDRQEVGTVLQNLASLYESVERLEEAELFYKRSLDVLAKALGAHHEEVATATYNLGHLYMNEKRLAEAEPLLERALATYRTALGTAHPHFANAMGALGDLYRLQGRFGDAETLLKRVIQIDEKALGARHKDLAGDIQSLGNLYRDQGRLSEAERLYGRALSIEEKVLGPEHPDVSGTLADLAKMYMVQNDWTRAVESWRRSANAIVGRIKRTVSGSGQGSGQTLTGKANEAEQTDRFSGLVKVLHRLVSEGRADGAEELSESFHAAQWALSSEAAASLAQMAARGASGDPAIGPLVRKRQDLVAEWQALDRMRSAAFAGATDRRDKRAEAANLARLDEIDRQVQAIDARLQVEFPGYAALASPSPLALGEVPATLRPDEALVLFLVTPNIKPLTEEMFVWVVTKAAAKWARIDLGTSALQREVTALRCGLDATLWLDASDWPEATEEQVRQRAAQIARRQRCEALTQAKPRAELVGMVPFDVLPFDAGRAHELYKALFGQVEDLIRGKHLLVVPSGPLTSLPFHVLVAEPARTAVLTTLADYGPIAWLGVRQPITVLPSVASLKALRATAKASQARHALLGIGNPLLDGPDRRYAQLAQAARARQACPEQPAPAQQVAAIHRGPMPSFQSVFRGAQADIEKVRQWTPLPETADELCEIRARLGVPESDILLGASAREGTIKDLSASGRLAEYQILHFATHGALAGQVKGVAEPGLILTPPDQGTRDANALDHDDGFLTASEIAALKLDANWVILSACNTAAGTGENAEALSGMARAFFYAGARALLVSHWEVGSKTAVTLTTRVFEELGARPGIGRAEALRISMRALIEKGERWQAHPSQWAAFVVVGEGGQIP